MSVPSENGDYFKIIELDDKTDTKVRKEYINRVMSQRENPNFEWIHQYTGEPDKNLDDYSDLISKDRRFFSYYGLSWIYNNKPFLIELLNGGTIPIKDYEHLLPDRNEYKLDGWNSERIVTILFHSQWCKPIELVFYGVTALNLRPCCNMNIFGVSLLMQNETIYFNDEPFSGPNKDYEGTWIESYGLRWRFLE